MATRQEEVRNLTIMRDALILQEELTKKIKSEEEYIKEQEERSIPNFPEFKYEEFDERTKEKEEEEKKRADSVEGTYFYIKLIETLAILVAFIVCAIVTGDFWDSGIEVCWMILLANICVWCAVRFIFVLLQNFITMPILIKNIARAIIRGAIGIALGIYLYFNYEKLQGIVPTHDRPYNVLSDYTLICAILAVGGAIAYAIFVPHATRKAKKAAQIAERNEKLNREAFKKRQQERLAAYNKQKALADVRIAQQRAELAAEITRNIAQSQANIKTYKQELIEAQQLLIETPGLAHEDKNLYTVSIILRYFERYKVDSIKEAINLFDAEERQKEASREASRAAAERAVAINNWIKAQRDTLKDMETNQRRHNERMEEEARRARERVEDELDRLNR